MINFKEFPTTRYQGSKRRLLPWLYAIFKDLEYETVLDGFGGTGIVSYLFKIMGKKVHYNDVLRSNYISGIAIIENSSTTLNDSDIKFLLNNCESEIPFFISNTFEDIYYYPEENEWLDRMVFNINQLSQLYQGDILRVKQALAFYALFQACLSKRPFNLFHRKNLYLRKNHVSQSFGNQKTWDKDFAELFIKFANEVSSKVFSNNKRNRAFCTDILAINDTSYDLIYLDPPYQRLTEKHPKNYFSLYHFLEGMLDYENWSSRIDISKKHKPLLKKPILDCELSMLEILDRIITKFNRSIIALSYGTPGKPTISELKDLMIKHGKKVQVLETTYSYKLNKNNGSDLREVLLVGT